MIHSVLRGRALLLAGLCLLSSTSSIAQPKYPTTPGESKIVYSDLVHFSEAYQSLVTNPDTLQVLQDLYFDRGSVGLKEFINRHQLTPELMKKALSAHPERYALIPAFLERIDDVQQGYQVLMKDYSMVMPNAMYPPTYLLVGANRGIGQASLAGQLITITRVVDDPEKFRKLLIHELSHFQQAMAMGGQKYASLYSTPNNLLGLCLREGGAEFITSLVLDDITQTAALSYIDGDETNLKRQFLEDLQTQNTDFWLWASLNQQTYPKLLGYAMGYKICRAYYESAPDKSVALGEILKMEDAQLFMTSSGYFD